MHPSTFPGGRRCAAGLLFAAVLLGGCVLSETPFYSEAAVIAPLVSDGTWQRLERDGSADGEVTWRFEGDEVTAAEAGGRFYGFKVTWFRVNNATFIDTQPLPQEDEPAAGEAYWLFHHAPFHMVSRVEAEPDRLRIRPLTFKHFNDATASAPVAPGTIKRDYATLVYDADAAAWADFLARHAGDEAVFPADTEIVFVRR
jgi:hypothetical protein